jgi:hypothetical protein
MKRAIAAISAASVARGLGNAASFAGEKFWQNSLSEVH